MAIERDSKRFLQDVIPSKVKQKRSGKQKCHLPMKTKRSILSTSLKKYSKCFRQKMTNGNWVSFLVNLRGIGSTADTEDF